MKKICIFLVALSLLTSCDDDKIDPKFEISSTQVGMLKKTTTVKQLDSIFKNDSMVKAEKGSRYLSSSKEITIYDKKGEKLLIMEPIEGENPDATIESVQIIDKRYQTASGISSDSYFKDIKDNYPISKIENTLSSAVVFVDSLNAYFTIDKKELPLLYRGNTDQKIEAQNIPDSAKVKHFWVSW
ncbi:hypothetical protein EV197_3027 [Aquimarina brevivitae]|uniref:Uncharacterized protein n=2 Tax=Aquimarina brevivitae TaxID=323412 RepID=A0A4Q7NX39_9FLAO|nr:hypothetical protein EV197_3027 [Aquimarina brevivitae]